MAEEKKYSYIKYPFSKNGWICFVLGCVSFILTAVVLVISILNKGQVQAFHAACGVTALVFSILGLWFAFLSFGEKEKNYLFAFIGGGMNLCLAVAWTLIVLGGN